MSARRIQELYNKRGTQISQESVDDCIASAAEKLGISHDEVIQEITEYVENNNYVGFKPPVWKSSNKNTSRNTFILKWISNTDSFKDLNAKAVKKISKKPSLRVCSFNVHSWAYINGNFKFDDMLAVIQDIDADVVCLQEAILPNDMRSGSKAWSKDGWERKDLISKFEEIGYDQARKCSTNNVNHTYPGTFFGNAILSKHTIHQSGQADLEKDALKGESRCYVYSTIKIDGKQILIANVHLDVWDDTEKTRVNQIKQMIRELEKFNMPIILCGDLNSLKRSDYTDDEWQWIIDNNLNVKPKTLVTDELSQSYNEAFDDGEFKYSVWTGRRVDYMWYRGENISVSKANVYYTDLSDHFPIFVDFSLNAERKPSPRVTKPSPRKPSPQIILPKTVAGKFDQLMWTHNTPYETLYKMMKGDYDRLFKCCDDNGKPIGRGAQFRYGLDSQYGDIMFIMKRGDWWKNVKGVMPNLMGGPSRMTQKAVLGHFFKDDFIAYTKGNEAKINKMLTDDAEMYDFRPKNISGSGTECKLAKWEFTWCNIQLHSGSPIYFDMVEKVLVPQWMVEDKSSLPQLSDRDDFIKMISNDLPKFPDGQINPLDGKFVLYGPKKMSDHYQYFRQGEWVREWYGALDASNYQQFGSTARNPFPAGNSSKIAVSAEAFEEAEKIYVKTMIESGCEKKVDEMKPTYLLYVVPKTQPEPSSQAEIYGGYHITLFPEQEIPEDFDVKKMMKTFPMSGKRWKLPGDSKLIGLKRGLNMIDIESNTLSRLMDHFQEPNGPFDPETRWEPLHVTLGERYIKEPVNARDLYEIFMNETEWFVQLVERKPLIDNTVKDPSKYSWTWLTDQRVPLYSVD